MGDVSTGDTITIENSSGSRATLRIDHVFSSRIFFTQLKMEGKLDLSETAYISPHELERYTVLEPNTDPAAPAAETTTGSTATPARSPVPGDD